MKADTRALKAINAYNQAVKELKESQLALIEEISISGFTKKAVTKKLGVSLVTYYNKQRDKTFTVDEMRLMIKLLKVINV